MNEAIVYAIFGFLSIAGQIFLKSGHMLYFPGMHIRLLKKADIPILVAMYVENYSPRDRAMATAEIQSVFKDVPYPPHIFVAEEKGTITGFGGWVEAWMDDDACEICWINVQRAHQGHGVGTRIVKKVLADARKKGYLLAVLSTKIPGFYRRLGFKTIKKVLGSDYQLMSLDLQ